MTERRNDPGFTVAPRPLGDGAGQRGRQRGRRVGIAVVLAGAAAIIVVAFFGPRLTGRPNLDLAFFATPTPVTTPSPLPSLEATPTATPGITPLPEITRPEGAGPAEGRVAIAADGMRVIDLGSGEIQRGAALYPGRDAVVRAPDGVGWTCVCFVDDLDGEAPIRRVRVVAMDDHGSETGSAEVAALPLVIDAEFGNESPATDVDLRTDGRHALLGIATRIGNTWRIDLSAIDVGRRRAGPTVKLGIAAIPAGQAPAPSPSASSTPSLGTDQTPDPTPELPPLGYFIDGPHVRIAPGGHDAFVWATVQSSRDVLIASAVHVWKVELDDDGGIGRIARIAGLDGFPSFCGGVAFATPDRLAWLCPQFPTDPNEVLTTFQIGSIDLDGRLRGTREIPVNDGFFAEPLFDQANGYLYAWDASTLALTRIDVRTLESTTVNFDPAADAQPGIPSVGGEQPEWRDGDSAVQQYWFSQAAGSPDGSRLYLIAYDRDAGPYAMSQPSLGVLVVDRETLALVDRWAPASGYVGLSVAPNGLVLAMGQPGTDADGNEAPWQGSLTVHDPSDGRILVRYGQLGQDSPPLVFDR